MYGFLVKFESWCGVLRNYVKDNPNLVKIGQKIPAALRQEISKVKCKAIPLQAWTGPEGSSRLRFPDFKTIGT